LNVWYVSAHDQPRGISARTYDFALELVRLGHTVTLFTNSYCHWTHREVLEPGERWRIEEVDGIRVVWLRTFHYRGNGWRRGVNMLTNAHRALQAARSLQEVPDVVVGPSVPLATGWAAARIARRRGAAFVFEVRDVWPIALVDDGALWRHSPVYYAFRAIEKRMYRVADRISATMPYVFKHIADSGGDPDKVQWLPNGIDGERFSGFPPFDGGRPDRIVIMYVGGFGSAHDVPSLVRAAAILHREAPQAYRFILVGSGPKKAACIAEARASGLTNVEFRDPVPKADVPRLQTESDVLVAAVTDSNAYRFGLNLNKIVDYFASGRPVVFSGNAPNDPIRESQAGFSVAPESPEAMAGAFRKLRAMSPEERRAMGERGRRYVESNFDMKVLGRRMEQLMLEARAARPRL
jgi:glycosyltransferase involved in cell wall biosynthesis